MFLPNFEHTHFNAAGDYCATMLEVNGMAVLLEFNRRWNDEWNASLPIDAYNGRIFNPEF